MGTSAEATTEVHMVPMRLQLKKFFNIGYEGLSNECEKNIAIIKVKQGSPDAVVGFYRPARLSKTLFYPPVQAFAIEPPSSHS